MFGFSANDLNYPVNDRFENVGYESTSVIMTLGDKFYYLLAGPFIILILRILVKYCKPRHLRCSPCRKLYAYFEAQDEGLRWNGVIGFFA
jgi:hypothetical protein